MSDKKKVYGSCKTQLDKYYKYKNELEGKIFYTYFGTPFKIKEYISSGDILIEFEFSGIQKHIKLETLMRGTLKIDPFYKTNGRHCPFTFENIKDKYIGNHYKNNLGEVYRIIDYVNESNVTIKFLDPPYYEKTTTLRYVENGSVKNPYHKNIYGGFIGEDTTYSNSNYTWLLHLWNAILFRANSKELFHEQTNNYAYDNCIVCNEWLEYPIFARDYMSKYNLLNKSIDYDIDKDLLYPLYKDKTNGLKVYSNETTVLLPKEINRSFISLNPYKFIHEKRKYLFTSFIDKLENYWKDRFKYYLDIGALLLSTYQILENLRQENIKIATESYNSPYVV